MYNLQSHEKRIFYLTGGFVLAWVLIIGLLIYPRYRAITKINSEINELRAQLELKYEKTKRLHRSKINLASAQDLANKYQNLFLRKGDELKLIVALESLAEKHGLKQKINMSPEPRLVTKKLFAFDLNVSVSGNLFDMLAYLHDLERKFEPVAAVRGFSFTVGVNDLRQKEINKDNSLSLRYQAEVYVRD